jgi:hypothetical protein
MARDPLLLRALRRVRVVLLAGVCAWSPPALADAPGSSGAILPIFTIAKSENKNQVQYTVRVDAHCAPAGAAPVAAYWRMLERGPSATEPILPVEVQAYGLASQAVIASDERGGEVRATLRALPSRALRVTTSRASDGTCRATAEVAIGGQPAHLFNVYAHLAWLGVDYLLLQGWTLDGARVVREKIAR